MNRVLNWDDLKVVLTIATAGSLSGAGRALGLSHATVFRRIGGIEERLGVKLFERQRRGYTPTQAGEDIVASARSIEAEVHDIERRVAGRDLRPSGTVRVTTTDTLLLGLLSPIFATFRQAYPEISLEVIISNEVLNLSRREADVAIRPSSAPPETLVGRKVATIAQAIYGHDRIAPSPDTLDFRTMDWLGPDERMAYRPLEQWMAAHELDDQCQYRVDTVLGMFAAVCDGTGLAVLPCYLCDGDARLVRVGKPLPTLATDLWLLTHQDLRRVARIRTFLDYVADEIRQRQAMFSGPA